MGTKVKVRVPATSANVCDRYDVSIETALADVQQTMNQWLELGIVIS